MIWAGISWQSGVLIGGKRIQKSIWWTDDLWDTIGDDE